MTTIINNQIVSLSNNADYKIIQFKPYSTSSTGDVTVLTYTMQKDGKLIVCITNIGPNRWPKVWIKKNGEVIYYQGASTVTTNKTDNSGVNYQDSETTYCWCEFQVKQGDTITCGTNYDRADNHKGCFWLII